MKKNGLIFILIVGIFLVSFKTSLAQVSLATPAPKEITSFELFWPVVAGKTMDDSLYTFKTLKENARGFLIFGKMQKADYHVFLATKRIVEAEKLINNDKKDLALKTLDKAVSFLKSAEAGVSDTIAESISSETKDNIKKQLGNLEIFIPWLSSRKSELSVKLQEILEIVKTLNSKV